METARSRSCFPLPASAAPLPRLVSLVDPPAGMGLDPRLDGRSLDSLRTQNPPQFSNEKKLACAPVAETAHAASGMRWLSISGHANEPLNFPPSPRVMFVTSHPC